MNFRLQFFVVDAETPALLDLQAKKSNLFVLQKSESMSDSSFQLTH